ncbi:hypothetical protein D3C85_1490260 [compost metagenome]
MAFTRTRLGANSRARFCVILFTAALEAEYVNTRESGGSEETDEILIMLPPSPRSTMYFPNTWQASTTLFKFTSIIESHSSMEMSKKGVALFLPGQFIRISALPDQAITSFRTCSKSSRLVASAEKVCASPPMAAMLSRTCSLFS